MRKLSIKNTGITIIAIILSASNIFAQKAILEADEIIIGRQITLNLQIESKIGQKIIFPQFENEIIPGIEIIDKTGINKYQQKGTIEQSFTITSFEDSTFFIPPFEFIVDKDTLLTNSLKLRSFYIPDSATIAKIDTSQLLKIVDIKSPKNTPLTLKEFWQRFGIYIIIAIIIIILGLISYKIYRRIKDNKPIFSSPKPEIPADIWALEKLTELRGGNYLQENKIKEYYSELIQIIKIYIEKRYKIMAPEYTSTELIQTFKYNKIISKELQNDLKRILSFADYAKFAKAKHTINDNDKNLELAISFVENTKEIILEPEEKNLHQQK